MAKRKNMTAEEVETLIGSVLDAVDAVKQIDDAISKVQVDDMPDPARLGRSLVAAARDLNQTALYLFHRQSSQEVTAKIREHEARLANAQAAKE